VDTAKLLYGPPPTGGRVSEDGAEGEAGKRVLELGVVRRSETKGGQNFWEGSVFPV
jgi:hypothetical protein